MASDEMSHSGDQPDPTEDHPEGLAIQRYADGELDPDSDRSAIEHVATCDRCRAEVERLRRVDAAIALSSRAPDDLFPRLKARRAAGERVSLPVPSAPNDHQAPAQAGEEQHPDLEDLHRFADGLCDPASDEHLIEHVTACASCQAEVEMAQRGAAVIALASRTPDVAFDRIRARRVAGDRVLLPMPPAPQDRQTRRVESVRATVKDRQTLGRHRFVWASAVAAALVLGIGIRAWYGPLRAGRSGDPRVSDPVAVGDSVRRPTRPVADPILQEPVAADSSLAFAGARDSLTSARAWVATRASLDRVQIAATAMTPVRQTAQTLAIGLVASAFDDTTLIRTTASAVQEIGVILSQREAYRILVRSDDSSATPSSTRVAAARVRAVADGLVAGGVDRRRIRLDNVVRPSATADAVVTIEINRSTSTVPGRVRP